MRKILIASLLLACCKSPVSPDLTSSVHSVPEKPPVTEVKTRNSSEVRELFEEWITAQNNGDFDTYSSFYGETFVGVKRVREKTTTFNREDWLTDRERMFQKKMVVSVLNPHIVVLGQEATIRFVQSWQSGSYKDIGPKEILVRIDGDSLKILREEMVRSTASTAKGSSPALKVADLLSADKILAFTSHRVLLDRRSRHGDGRCSADNIAQKKCSVEWLDTAVQLPSDIKRSELGVDNAKSFLGILSNPKSYDSPIAACFDPRLALAFYHAEESLPFATVSICIDCAGAGAYPNIDGLFPKLGPEDDYGLSVVGIRDWCSLNGLQECTQHRAFYEDGGI